MPKLIMETRYYTDRGSVYVWNNDNGKELWEKISNGISTSIDKGFYVPKKNLVRLVEKYRPALDETSCLDEMNEKDFLEDTMFESAVFGDYRENSENVILFLVMQDNGKYQIRVSSNIVKVEEKQ